MNNAREVRTPGCIVDLQVAMGCDDAPSGATLRRWARHALRGSGPDCALTVRIVDEAEMAELNERFRGKRGATNVLSFAGGNDPDQDLDLLGDVVICAPVVVREAREQARAVEAHWAHMVVHGILHLRGYDHQQDDEARRMEQLETEFLSALGYADPCSPTPGAAPTREFSGAGR